jgi:hypothetical protein
LDDCRGELQNWSYALVAERVADSAHRVARAGERAVNMAAVLLEDLGERATADVLREQFAVCRERAEETLRKWQESTGADVARAADEGFLGGATMIARPRSGEPMRRFATYENTPAWLHPTLRAQVVRLLRGVDVVRLLHAPDIERRSLIVSLWLRAAFVLVAPLARTGSLTRLVPFGPGVGLLGDVVWIAISAFALTTAVLSSQVADYTIYKPTRVRLFVVEQALTTLGVIATPCWAVAIFGSGAVNWIERPDWRLRKLLFWMALTYLPLIGSAMVMGVSGADAVLEAVIGVCITAVMAGSYGLMFPATVTTFVGALWGTIGWRARAYVRARRDRRDVQAVLDQAGRDVQRLAAGDPRAEDVLSGLHRTRGQMVDPRQFLRRRSRVLEVLCSQAITAVVPPEGAIADTALKATLVVSEPPTVGELYIAEAVIARRLERLIKRLVLEALDSEAEGAVYSRLALLYDGRVELTIANDVGSEQPRSEGFRTGGDWLRRWRAGIPGCEELEREKVSGNAIGVVGDVFSVRIAIGREVFQHDDGPGDG